MRTVFWENGRVKMIDQRLLPAEFVLAEFAGVEFASLIERLIGSARLHAGRRMRERRMPGACWTGIERRTPRPLP